MVRTIHFESIGAFERNGQVIISIVERFTEDRIELAITNVFAADDLAEAITESSNQAARVQDGEA